MPYPMAAARGHTSTAAGGAWSPLDLASLTAWWDFSDADTLFTDAGTTPVSADAQAIYRANDKSGNDWYLEQTTEASRPIYKTGIQNGLSVALSAAGQNRFLTRSSVSWNVQEWFFVAQMTTDASNLGALIAQNTGYGFLNVRRYNATETLRFSTADGYDFTSVGWIDGVDTDNYSYGSFHIIRARRASAANYTEPQLFGSVYGRYWRPYIAEALAFGAALSSADANTLGNYLADKWDLSWTDIA